MYCQKQIPAINYVFLRAKLTSAFIFIVFISLNYINLSFAQSTDDCFGCHADLELEAEDGHLVGVDEKAFKSSIHGDFDCIDCHEQPGDYEDIPHFTVYRPVDCSSCHDDASASFKGSFHDVAHSQGVAGSPSCSACHGLAGNPHTIHSLNQRTAESACQQCHKKEALNYDGSVHASAAQKGKASPGCIGCHPTHSAAYPPSTGAVNNLCESCHQGSMEEVHRSGHMGGEAVNGVMSCAACHDIHATHRPHLDKGTIEACANCHPGTKEKFDGSVHEGLFLAGTMNCLSCHRTHQVMDANEVEDFGCGRCHEDSEKEYRTSVHRLARLHGDEIAATCADCHEGHHILPPADPDSPVNHFNIPNTCGNCHTNETVITADYVRLPISLPNYEESIHGAGWKEGKATAVCSDCHGSHLLQSASNHESKINKINLANTCGQCHLKIAEEYKQSVHGRALAHGITDSPSCTDCHDEHLIYATDDPRSAVNPSNQADETCGKCHSDPEMAARYGLPEAVIESYQDSYHGWAIGRGGKTVASCEDCHNTHSIGSRLDPESSIHPDNVVATCGRCHENSNPKFAASYTHILARGKMMIHDWVRIIYLWLIGGVLGGMFVHNLVIFIYEMRIHYRKTKDKPAIKRMTKNETWQHMILTISFTVLAVTGFALRFPDAWWAVLLQNIGMNEEIRRLIHRIMAAIMVGASFYHAYYLVATNRGRMLLKAIFPKMRDAKEAITNVSFYLGLTKKRTVFGMYDYTQKAEYWALIWGTVVMAITGVVLLYPDIATNYFPAWLVRVSETIHFYEAILAVSAIIIWHFFFVIILPKEYPMSWIWITGRMPKDEWEHHHGREPEDTGQYPEQLPGVDEEE
ncbi:MAG: cytochrome c3 family protein [Candidatus Electryonea clarkiae]|nr:cytochrome c3 family protein [Candidatus Electryonea clarkiae]MDP8287651.1 cytochrome c3 family protein [Candidatus Electryonea clarkiae]